MADPGLLLLLGTALAAGPAPAAQCLDEAARASLVVLHPRGSRLTAIISPEHGGQLVGLQIERGGRTQELLYRGMNFCPVKGWDGKAPLLWPATGRSYAADPAATGDEANLGWIWQGQRYPMPIHGFARSVPWRLLSVQRARNEDSVELRLDQTAATLAAYPFRFAFTVRYRLRGDRLRVDHRIIAGSNQQAMPFSIGNHISFALPLGGQGQARESTVSTGPTRRIRLDRFGRPAETVAQAPLHAMPIRDLGREVAWSLAGYGRDPVSATIDQPGWGSITLNQAGSMRASSDPIRFNLWGNMDAAFFSPEPWIGMQNSLNSGDGLIRLRPGATFRWQWSVRINPQPGSGKKQGEEG